MLDPFSPYLEAVLPWRDSRYGQAILKKLAQKYDIKETTVRKELPDRYREVVVNGDDELIRVNTGGGKFVSLYYKGIEDVLTGQYNQGILTVDFQAMLEVKSCPVCVGAKLRQESLHVFISRQGDVMNKKNDRYSIYDLQCLPIEELVTVVSAYKKTSTQPGVLVERIIKPLLDRSETITDLGL